MRLCSAASQSSCKHCRHQWYAVALLYNTLQAALQLGVQEQSQPALKHSACASCVASEMQHKRVRKAFATEATVTMVTCA
eukprot:11710-Heterococcus_DN1.PRE.4